MPQTPTGKQRILRLDGSIVDEFGNVITTAPSSEGPFTRPGVTPKGDFERKTFPGGSWALQPTDADAITGRDLGVTALKALSTVAGFIPSMKPLQMAARIALPAAFEGGAAALEGKDVSDTMLEQATMGAAGEGLGKTLPRLFNRAALASGGLFRGENRLANRATQAFTDINARRPVWNPLLVGNVSGAQKLKKEAGLAVEAAERSTPGKVSLPALGGANADYATKAVNTSAPVTLRALIGQFDRKFIEQQAMARNGIHPAIWGKLTAKQKLAVIDSTELTARDLGELKRGVGASSNPVVKARREGTFVPEQDAQKATMEANLTERTNKLRQGLDKANDGRIAKADKEFGDAAATVDAHQAMRSTSALGDPSYMGARAVPGSLIATALGLPWQYGMLLGPALLNPKALSAEGHVLGYGARATPTGVRGASAIDSTREDKRKARRRKPGGR